MKQMFFLQFPCFLYDSKNVASIISSSSTFSKPSLYLLEVLGSQTAKT